MLSPVACPHCTEHAIPRGQLALVSITFPVKCRACGGAVAPRRHSFLWFLLNGITNIGFWIAAFAALWFLIWWPIFAYCTTAILLRGALAWGPVQQLSEQDIKSSKRNFALLVVFVVTIVLIGGYKLWMY